MIPLELQRLFASLLLVDQQSASTSDLTDSFGWNSTEVCLSARHRNLADATTDILVNGYVRADERHRERE